MAFLVNSYAFGSGTAKTEWRIVVTNIDTATILSFSEIIMRDTIWTGSNLCTDGNSTISVATGTGAKANLFDGDVATYWASAASPGTVTISFNFGTPKEVLQVVLCSRSDGDFGQEPEDFTIEYKDGGGSWQTWLTVTGQTGWQRREGRAYTASGRTTSISGLSSFTYAGIFSTSGTGKTVAELEFRNGSAADQCSGGTATAIGSIGTIANAFDDNLTNWATYNAVDTGITYAFASAVTIVDMTVTARTGGFYTQAPTAMYLFVSPDGFGWISQSWTPAAWVSNNQVQTYTFT